MDEPQLSQTQLEGDERDSAGEHPDAKASLRAFPNYSDAELEQLLSDIRRFDEDSYITVAHSNAVKD